MVKSKLFFLLLISIIFSCNYEEKSSILAKQIKNNEITILGNPDSSLLAMYLSDTLSFKYIFNPMMTIDVIAGDTGVYHCFIMEDVNNQKQLSYFVLDDVVKYNYIPYYDSLEYDLSITFEQSEYEGKKWSSKFEQIPYLRKKSKEYQQLVSTCDDAQDLADFYNNSLYFHSDCETAKIQDRVLTKLIEITQVQLVGTYLQFDRPKSNYIILGFISYWNSYKIIKFKILRRREKYYFINRGYEYYSYNFDFWISQLNRRLIKNFKELDGERYIAEQYSSHTQYVKKEIQRRSYFEYSPYLLNIQKKNLNFIKQNINDLKSLQDSCDIMICLDYKYSDSRIFFFNIVHESNKIKIKKNYYNKEFLPTTRMSNYYLLL